MMQTAATVGINPQAAAVKCTACTVAQYNGRWWRGFFWFLEEFSSMKN